MAAAMYRDMDMDFWPAQVETMLRSLDARRRGVRLLEAIGEPAGIAQVRHGERMEECHPSGLKICAGLTHQCEALGNALRQRVHVAQLSANVGDP